MYQDGLHLLPNYMHGGVIRYIENGIPGGSFLTAVFENSLVDAYGRADVVNESNMKNWAEFLYMYAPSECWRSHEKVRAWVERGGLRGKGAAMAGGRVMRTEYTVLRADGTAEGREVDWPEAPTFKAMSALIEPILEADLERANVFWDGKYTDMFVDDCGKLKGLPRNEKATTIYRNNCLVHDPVSYPDPEKMPCIYGTAILFSRKVWF